MYDRHLITHGQRTIALYRVNTTSYPLLADPAKAEVMGAWRDWAHKLEADFSIYRVCRFINAAEYAEQAKRLASPTVRKQRWDAYIDEHVPVLADQQGWSVECYVAVSLTSTQQVAAGVNTVRWVREFLAGLRRHVPEALVERERHVRDALAMLAGRPATPREVQWLFRRAALRGVREPDVDPHWQHQRGRHLSTLRERFADDPLHERDGGGRTLIVGGDDEHCFQTVMAVGARPAEIEFPGCEYMFNPPESLDFPVDMALHVIWQSNAEALVWAGQKVKDADGAWTEATGEAAEPPSWKVGQDRRLTRDLVQYLQHPSRPPLLWGTLSAAFSASTRADLEKRRLSVAAAFGSVTVECPRFVQAPLWWDHVPGSTGAHQRRYEEPLTTAEFGALIPNGTHEAGDRSGVYLGHTTGRIRRPILIDLPSAPLGSGLPGWMILGVYGSGKALDLHTPIRFPGGWTTMGDLKVGDKVYDERGKPCRVTHATPVMHDRDCYVVRFSDGSEIIADGDHRWETWDLQTRQAASYRATMPNQPLGRGTTSRFRGVRKHRNEHGWVATCRIPGGPRYLGHYETQEEAAVAVATARRNRGHHKNATGPAVRTTREIRDTLRSYGLLNHAIPVAEPIAGRHRNDLPIEPYLFGVWLGDGGKHHGTITIGDDDANAMVAVLSEAGHEVRPGATVLSYIVKDLRRSLRLAGLLGETKWVPHAYLDASFKQRLALFQGLMDTDGYTSATGRSEFCSTNQAIADAAYELVISLGMKATRRSRRVAGRTEESSTAWRICFTPTRQVHRLPRKAANVKVVSDRSPIRFRYITAVDPVDSVPVRCITVDSPSHLYLAGESMIPTHNTLLGEKLLIDAVMRGSIGVSIDPKGDHFAAEWLAMQGIVTQVIEPTGAPDDQGLLDPLVVAPPWMREDRAVSYYLDLIGDKDGYETQIIRAVRAVLDSREPCGKAVIAHLLASDHPRAQAAGDALAVRAESGIGRLGFAERGGDVARYAQMTTIRPRGLDLPRAGLARENWSRDQRLGSATMKLLVAFGMRLLGDDRGQHKVFKLDELHVFRDNDGQQLIEQAAHYGRSYNCSALFAAQLDTMVTDELSKLVGYRAHMRRKGEGTLTDHLGRAANFQVDFTSREMLEVLNTAPDADRNRRRTDDLDTVPAGW